MLRSVLERVFRNRMIKRHLPSSFGRIPIYVSPDAQLRYLLPGKSAFDQELMQVVRDCIRENSVVWDIGANVGVFAFEAAWAARKGSVLAVEADPWLAQMIRKSLHLRANRVLHLEILSCAVADKNGTGRFLISKRGRASNALESAGGRSRSGGTRERLAVPTLTLDTLLDSFDSPSFVKMDIEGAEAMALRGARRLLAEVRPVFYIEVGPEANEEVASIFQDAHYSLFDGSLKNPTNCCAYNTLAIPEESLRVFKSSKSALKSPRL